MTQYQQNINDYENMMHFPNFNNTTQYPNTHSKGTQTFSQNEIESMNIQNIQGKKIYERKYNSSTLNTRYYTSKNAKAVNKANNIFKSPNTEKAFEPVNDKGDNQKQDISLSERDEDSNSSYRNSRRKDTSNHKNLQTIETSGNYKKVQENIKNADKMDTVIYLLTNCRQA